MIIMEENLDSNILTIKGESSQLHLMQRHQIISI